MKDDLLFTLMRAASDQDGSSLREPQVLAQSLIVRLGQSKHLMKLKISGNVNGIRRSPEIHHALSVYVGFKTQGIKIVQDIPEKKPQRAIKTVGPLGNPSIKENDGYPLFLYFFQQVWPQLRFRH